MTTSNLVSAQSGLGSAHNAPQGLASADSRAAGDALAAWYGGGERFAYDPRLRALSENAIGVFVRWEGDLSRAVTFLPGFPDGSSGWASVLPYLPAASAMPKLFLDYIGMGDSDKPSDYRFSTAERADLVETLWRELGVESTTLVAFDFSSLVVLEHLRRRLERAARGEPEGGPEIRGVFIFNGGLFTDGHSHPWWTTPILRRLPARSGPVFASQSFGMFMMMGGVMWSRRFAGRTEAGRRVYDSLRRRDGMSYLSRAAGFAADHKAQGERLDFGRLYMAWRNRFPFLVGGSADDKFEHRQVDLAERRLARFGLEIARLPGGHMTMDEEPRALAELIARFDRKLAPARIKPGVDTADH
jgi:pimeloyl-ACP methyl ester carboxylesterase